MILARSKEGRNETIHVGESLEDVVYHIHEDHDDPEDFFFYEVDITSKFEVVMKAVRKEIPVRVKK